MSTGNFESCNWLALTRWHSQRSKTEMEVCIAEFLQKTKTVKVSLDMPDRCRRGKVIMVCFGHQPGKRVALTLAAAATSYVYSEMADDTFEQTAPSCCNLDVKNVRFPTTCKHEVVRSQNARKDRETELPTHPHLPARTSLASNHQHSMMFVGALGQVQTRCVANPRRSRKK